jgi:ClpP class serine protease
MSARFAHLSQRLFNRPLAILPGKAELAMATLADRLGIAHMFRADGSAADLRAMAAFDDEQPASWREGYDIVAGVAVIDIEGMLVQRLGTLRPYCGMTGYDGIRANLLTALADPAVKAIAFTIASPGGEVSGCFDLADTIHAARGEKPLWAICSEEAYSAAYALASACDHITVPRTGGVGSIGVIAMLVDFSKALSEGGVAVHFIHHGARKAEVGRAQYEGVKPDLLARLQVEIDAFGDLFTETVACNRGVAAKAIRDLQAACIPALNGQAVKAGLADAVMAPDAAFQALVTSLG